MCVYLNINLSFNHVNYVDLFSPGIKSLKAKSPQMYLLNSTLTWQGTPKEML